MELFQSRNELVEKSCLHNRNTKYFLADLWTSMKFLPHGSRCFTHVHLPG